jgi:hypothetical protein
LVHLAHPSSVTAETAALRAEHLMARPLALRVLRLIVEAGGRRTSDVLAGNGLARLAAAWAATAGIDGIFSPYVV